MKQAVEPRTTTLRERAFAGICDRLAQDRGPREPAWTSALRRCARDRFEEIGWPTQHHEEWLYTDLSPLRGASFTLGTPPAEKEREGRVAALAPWRLGSAAAAEIVFVNGHYDAALSRRDRLPEGISVEPLAAALEKKATDLQPFLGNEATWSRHAPGALNTACMQDGLVLHASRRRTLEKPIHVLFLAQGQDGAVASFPRLLIVGERSSRLALVETHAGLGPGTTLCDTVCEVVLDSDAALSHTKVVAEAAGGIHLGTMRAVLASDAHLENRLFSLSGRLVRNDLDVALAGRGNEAHLSGLYVTDGEEHADIHTKVDHGLPHGRSHQLYKGVLDGKSTAAFSGRILVREDAQKTDATQSCRNLLLSEKVEVNAKPQLEIYADDVKCTHGATVGRLDAEALFYLRSRGIDNETAERLLIHGFMDEVIGGVQPELLRSQVRSALMRTIPHTARANRPAPVSPVEDPR